MSDQDEEAGSDATVWEKAGEESDSEGSEPAIREGARLLRERHLEASQSSLRVGVFGSWTIAVLPRRGENPKRTHSEGRDAVLKARISKARKKRRTASAEARAASGLAHRWVG